jgi:N-acetylmuramoyl-L-alanine amidase
VGCGLSMVQMADHLHEAASGLVRGWDAALPFVSGDTGPGVLDMQGRLSRIDYEIPDDELSQFGPLTLEAITQFQRDRGLRADGICGHHTWSSLVEAGYRLGDRLLYRRSPMLHGDDVADLQRRLSTFGFDPGGVDAIFGDNTAAALVEFQHNIGILSDGICGPRTLAELGRLSVRAGADGLVTSVREALLLARGSGSDLRGRTIAVGETGGFAAGAAALDRALGQKSAHCIPLHHPDEAEQAHSANIAEAECYIGLRLDPSDAGIRVFYYRGFRYESLASKELAQLVVERVGEALGVSNSGIQGMALPVLRLTKMPAVVVELGNPPKVAVQATDLAQAITLALSEWIDEPR